MDVKQEQKVKSQEESTLQAQNLATKITAWELLRVRGQVYFTWWSETAFPVKSRLDCYLNTEDIRNWCRRVNQFNTGHGE